MPTNYGTNEGKSPDCVAIAMRETSVMEWDISAADFDTKLQAVPTVAAVEVSRTVLPADATGVHTGKYTKLGYEWLITFKGNHGNLKPVVCHKDNTGGSAGKTHLQEVAPNTPAQASTYMMKANAAEHSKMVDVYHDDS